MKWFALIVILSLAQVAIHLPGQGGNKKQHTQSNQNDPDAKATSLSKATAGPTVAVSHENEGKKQEESTSQQPSYWKEAFEPAYVANWGLVVIGVAAGVVAWQTLTRIADQAKSGRVAADAARDAAKAANTSAEAALRNAQAVIDAERAMILVNHNAPAGWDTWIFQFEATNHGKSPAEILWFDFQATVLDRDSPLPEKPSYVDKTNYLFVHREWGSAPKTHCCGRLQCPRNCIHGSGTLE